MEGDRIKDLKKILDEIFLNIEKKDFSKLEDMAKILIDIDLDNLDNEEKIFFKNALDQIVLQIENSKKDIINKIKNSENIKLYKND